MTEKTKSLICLILVCFLVVSAFAVRVNNFKKTTMWTVDEMVYYHLGGRLTQGWKYYNTIEFTKIFKEERNTDKAPAYFTKSLFKHPPLFALMISLSIKIFGVPLSSAVYVSAFFGSMLILLGFLIGRLFFDEKTGLLTAGFLWLDPVSTICSQKIWMDTTLAFFTGLSITLFCYAMNKGKDSIFIWAGLAAGCAMLTKYPGILVLPVILITAALFYPQVLKKRQFQLGIALPFIMILPWVLWNVQVYGMPILIKHFSTHSVPLGGKRSIAIIILLIAVVFAALANALKQGSQREDEGQTPSEKAETDTSSRIRSGLIALIAVLFCIALHRSIFSGFNLHSAPRTSWQGGHFNYPLFYVSQLIKFSPLYLLSVLALFFYDKENIRKTAAVYLSIIVIGLFFLNWGNYQSRYILAAVPFLAVLGVRLIIRVHQGCPAHGPAGRMGRMAVYLLVAWIFLKTSYVNFLVSYPNDMSYF